jgi:molybdopterin synthase sulfur carrier subunit
MTTIRIVIPYHLRTLAQVKGEIAVGVDGTPSIRSVLDAIEREYPVLAGTIREHTTQKRRPFIRFYVGEEDWSLEPSDKPLPALIATGAEPLYILGAIAGGAWHHS